MICGTIPEDRKIYLEQKCTQEEIEDLQLIVNKITCAKQAINPRNIPEECTERQAELFVKGAIKARAEAEYLESYWWRSMIEKYKIDNKCYVDFNKRQFYKVKEEKEK